MPLGTTPPWIANLPPPLSVMQAGSQAGLGLGNLDLERKESVRRLMLGLAGIAQRSSEAAAHNALARATLAETTRRADADDLRQQRILELAGQRESRLSDEDIAEQGKPKFVNVGGRLVEITEGGDIRERFNPDDNRVAPLDRERYRSALSTIRSGTSDLFDPMKLTARPLIQATIDEAKKVVEEVEGKYIKPTVSGPLPGLSGGINAPPAKRWIRDSTGRLVPAQ